MDITFDPRLQDNTPVYLEEEQRRMAREKLRNIGLAIHSLSAALSNEEMPCSI